MVLKTLVCAIQWCRLEERRGAAALLGHQHNQRTERLWDVFRCASHLYFYTFYSIELSGILDTDNSVHLFTLNLVFQTRINQALCQFSEAFNHQNVRTEKKLVAIPNVAYHMMQPENPLSNGKSYDFEYYGDDPDGPTPLDSDNNVVVEEIDLDNMIQCSRLY